MSRDAGTEAGTWPTGAKVVMVVEDDDDIRESLTELLESWGFVPVAVNGGEAALGMLRGGFDPLVILLDLKMSGLSGWDFRREQMKDPKTSKIPVVISTALGPGHEAARAGLGDVTWLPKPFTPDRLKEVLSAAVESRGEGLGQTEGECRPKRE